MLESWLLSLHSELESSTWPKANINIYGKIWPDLAANLETKIKMNSVDNLLT